MVNLENQRTFEPWFNQNQNDKYDMNQTPPVRSGPEQPFTTVIAHNII